MSEDLRETSSPSETGSRQDLPEVDVIVDQQAYSGRFNMAMDEALLELAADRDRSTVRIYRWSEPTVTLGYFQASEARSQVENPFPGLPIVRRLSGGGAILHDRELTYSCVLPATHPVRHDPSQLYVIVHQALIQLLQQCGVNSMLRSDYDAQTQVKQSASEPFLCFLRQNPNDIVHASGIKIVGSAQRRRKGVILQHGSILLSASDHASQVPGIEQLASSFRREHFQDQLPQIIAASVGSLVTSRDYSAEELEHTNRLMASE
ncbi:MAG: lipoate--protein ligase family protein [Planctomycetaceae bacterium]|nr:lipoate--protein ligase family protein [Planctomycetaceae bacterium]